MTWSSAGDAQSARAVIGAATTQDAGGMDAFTMLATGSAAGAEDAVSRGAGPLPEKSTPGGGGSTADGAIDAPGDASADGGGSSNSGMGEVATTDAAVQADGGRDPAPTFHVFLLLGQSNMAGYPKARPADLVEDPRVRVLGYDDCEDTGRHENVWATASPPLHECWNEAIGPADYFAKTLIGVVPDGDTLGLVPCAISGEKIETFMKVGGSKYAWIIDRAKRAREAGGVIDGILFHQGEANCGDPSWPDKVQTLVGDLRTDLRLGDVPFLAGELVYTGGCSKHNSLVNQLPSLIANVHIVSAAGLGLEPNDEWSLHFDHDSQITLGKRYAQTMIDALGW